MKKTISALFAIASAAVFAGAGDLLVTFSTPGPDKYADDKPVLAGERYALVYTYASGLQTNVLTYSTREAGHCTPVLFVVSEANVSNFTGGEWGVYLLDTRDFENYPLGDTLTDAENISEGTFVKAKASDAVIKNSMDSAAGTSAITAGDFEIPRPTVTGIKVEGAYVYVTVQDIVPCLDYTLQSANDTFVFAVPEGVAKDPSSTIKEITLTVPKTEGAQFFKVTTK